MGCKSCKDSAVSDNLKVFVNGDGTREAKSSDIGFKIFNVIIRIVLFAIALVLVPIILLVVVYLLFKTIVLNKGGVNLMPVLLKIATSIGIGNKKAVDENPDDYEDLDPDNPDDYELDERVDKIEL